MDIKITSERKVKKTTFEYESECQTCELQPTSSDIDNHSRAMCLTDH